MSSVTAPKARQRSAELGQGSTGQYVPFLADFLGAALGEGVYLPLTMYPLLNDSGAALPNGGVPPTNDVPLLADLRGRIPPTNYVPFLGRHRGRTDMAPTHPGKRVYNASEALVSSSFVVGGNCEYPRLLKTHWVDGDECIAEKARFGGVLINATIKLRHARKWSK